LKIAWVCAEYPPRQSGGLGTFVQTLARGFAAAGHDAIVVEWGAKTGERDDEGVTVVTLRRSRLRGLSWIIDRMRLRAWLTRAARSGRIEAIEVPDFTGPLPFRFPHCPVFVRLHGAATILARFAGHPPSAYAGWCERRQLRFHRHWIAMSKVALERTVETFGVEPERAAVVMPPVTAPRGDDSACRLPRPFVLYAGEVSPRKGVHRIAEAGCSFLAAHKDLHLVFAGPVAPRAQQSIVAALGAALAGRVHFPGSLSRATLFRCMQETAVFVFPSPLESFGLVVAEAMLAGAPVVVSDLAPFTEYVEQGRTGLLVDPDDPGAIAEAVERALLEGAALGARASRRILSDLGLGEAVHRNLAFYAGQDTLTRMTPK